MIPPFLSAVKHYVADKGIVTLKSTLSFKHKFATALVILTAPNLTQAQESALEEVVITAALMASDGNRVSTSSLGNAEQTLRAAVHFEDLLTAIPNVSASAGASRQLALSQKTRQPIRRQHRPLCFANARRRYLLNDP